MRRIDILKKHKGAVDDLVQIGVIDACFVRRLEVYSDRRNKRITIKETARIHKIHPRTVCKDVRFLETEI